MWRRIITIVFIVRLVIADTLVFIIVLCPCFSSGDREHPKPVVFSTRMREYAIKKPSDKIRRQGATKN